jgi:murein DD-endopeptidase MepM/ murein hydrolase activator NlpD
VRYFRLLLIFITLTSSFALFGQEGNEPPILVAITARADENNGQQLDLSKIISDTLSVEFTINDYDTLHVTAQNQGDFLDLARDKGALYGVECLYVIKENILQTNLLLLRVANGQEIFSQSLNLLINLDLDFSLESVLREILLALEKDLLENPPVESSEKKLVKKANKKKESETVESEKTAESARESDFILEPLKRRKISAGFGPFLTTGEGNRYFPLGYMPQIHGEYRFPLPAGYGGIGLHGSANLFEIQGSIGEGQGYLVSLGPEFRLGVEGYSPLGMYLRISGGGSLFLLKKPEEPMKFTFIPYASTGLGVDIDLFPSLGLYLEGNYMVFFEKTLFVTGFYPSLGLQFKF